MKIQLRLLLLLSFFISLSGCSQQPVAETYLIPAGFKGSVNVIYGRKDGVDPALEGDSYVYRIPDDGILLVNNPFDRRIHELKYFFLSPAGERKLIRLFETEISGDSAYIRQLRHSGEMLVFGSGTAGIYGNSNDQRSVRWREFIISDFNNLRNSEPLDIFQSRVKKKIGYEF